ncbi:MAG: hypothetical protein AMJ62_08555 [Myxococcales bacterium SG8_38]|nr:MAG: hypothetical protein AMJ62_08555 [Myxococcales bacterium SG8_38]
MRPALDFRGEPQGPKHRLGELDGACESYRLVFAKPPSDHVVQPPGVVRVQIAQRRGLGFDDLGQDLANRTSSERHFARGDLVEDCRQREDVASRIHVEPPQRLLRRHVAGGAQRRAEGGELWTDGQLELNRSKVEYADVLLPAHLAHEHVARLEIPMNDPFGVSMA